MLAQVGVVGSGAGVGQAGSQDITNPALSGTILSLLGEPIGFFAKFFPLMVTFAFVVGAIIFFFMLIVGAIQWTSASGDKARLESARGRITSALVGIVILFAAFAIIKLIEIFFGTNILLLDLEPLRIQ